MTPSPRAPYSYRDDPAVPAFDDARALFVFDGNCVLCSGGASRIMRADRNGLIAFTPAAGELGAALYRHYGLAIDDTYLFLVRGEAFGLSEGYFRMADELGGWWRFLRLARIVPRALRDRAYRLIARNRYRWFGRTEACALLTEEQRRRLV